jgi:15-cis-phytoene synthase
VPHPTDRDLVRLYWPVALRPAFDALFAIDDALSEVVASSTQPALGAIRLAWWRDALGRLDHHPPPPEPRLQAAAAELLPLGVSGAALAPIAEGWAALFEEVREPVLIGERGTALFAAGATLLGRNDPQAIESGRFFALGDAARRGLAPVLDYRLKPFRASRSLRPLTGLALLALRDLRHGEPFEPEATPARAWALARHRLTGTIR